jgi:hypothetical protein
MVHRVKNQRQALSSAVRIRTNLFEIEQADALVCLSQQNGCGTESSWNLQPSDGVSIAKYEIGSRSGVLLTDLKARRQRYNRQPDGVWMSERNNATETNRNGTSSCKSGQDAASALHPAWLAFVRYCQQMGHGEIERLKIQDGIPVLVEVSRQKIKFS